MEIITLQGLQRPSAGLVRLLIILPGIGLLLSVGLLLIAGPEFITAAWVLARLAWRLVPPVVWAVSGAAVVFWLWLLRRLWAGEPIGRPKEGASGQQPAFSSNRKY